MVLDSAKGNSFSSETAHTVIMRHATSEMNKEICVAFKIKL